MTQPGKEERVFEICKKWELDVAIIGRVTDTGRWVIRATPNYDPLGDAPVPRAPVVVCDLPVDFLTDAAPKYDRPQADDPKLPARLAFDPRTIAKPESWSDALLGMLSHPNVGSRRWVYRQYDHIVRGGTNVRPGGNAAVVRVPCERDGKVIEKYLAFASDVNARLCELDPFQGAAMAVAEACRNLVCVGAEPIGLTDCLNFGNPERPEIMRQFSRAIDGLAAACKALEVPIVSGNVSLYNETDGRAILPTPTIGAVGLVRDPGDVVRAVFPREGLAVLLLGAPAAGPLGGSEWVAQQTGDVKGPPPVIDLAAEMKLQALVLELCRARPRLIESAHDISEGGFAVALAECCSATDDPSAMIGALVTLPRGGAPIAEALFGEAAGRIVVSCDPKHGAEVARRARDRGVVVTELGITRSQELVIADGATGPARPSAATLDVILRAEVGVLRAARESCLSSIVGE